MKSGIEKNIKSKGGHDIYVKVECPFCSRTQQVKYLGVMQVVNCDGDNDDECCEQNFVVEFKKQVNWFTYKMEGEE